MKRNFFIVSLVLVVCCFMVTGSWAAKKVAITNANSKGYIGQLNHGAAMDKVFGLAAGEGFQLFRQGTDFNGVTHSRYQQIYKGIPVWGMQAIVSKGRSGKVKGLHGNFVKETPNDIGAIPASLEPLGALNRMKDDHKAKNIAANWNFSNEKYGTFIFIDAKGKAHLTYMVSFFADTDCGDPSQPISFIDVRSGNVIHSFDGLRTADVGTGPGGNEKIGYYEYGTNYDPFGVTVDGSTCTMNTTDVKTVNLNHSTSGDTPYSYTCYENTYKSINGAYCPLNDAQFFGQVIYDMYQDWYGVPVLPFQLSMKVHYGTNVENAYWTGDSMLFGDGYTTFHPLVCLDVAAHEVSHGFTDFNSDLIYSGQSGGINESFSDMAGEAAEYYMRDSCDYMCGYDIFKADGQALRYLYDPPLDGRSIDHVDDYTTSTDVHYSSGIFNKAFYLIGSSPGWTARMAFDIFTKANMDYWTPSTNFQQGAEGAQAAAADYGYSCEDVRDAFAQVGIPLNCGGTSTADMFVDDITQTAIRTGRNYKSSAVVTIKDTDGYFVANATVYITWSGVVSGSTSGTTGAGGTVTFTSARVKSTGPFTITVTNVTHASQPYNSSLNNETSDTANF
jgi:pseudolysin/vibriolysin